ncbi:MAG: tetratricopeptide repeat protein [Deltaproteobacteria bacterium]|nr:tetratricopeptide repeat protein [Deltaproteobacteria bacterium]
MAPSGEDPQRGAGGPRDDRADTWGRFARHLVTAGVLTAADVEALQRDPLPGARSLPGVLLQRGQCEAPRLRQELADFFGVEAVGPEEIPLDPALMVYFPGELLVRLGCIPLTQVGTTMRLAMIDPSDERALRTLRGLVMCSIWPVVALEPDVLAALERAGATGSSGGGESGDTAFAGPLQRIGEALAAGHPEQALQLLAAEIGEEPAGGTDGGRRLSFSSIEEQQAFAAEHPDREVDWVDPAYGFARYLRGVALGDLGRLEEALVELERAVEWNPVSDRAHLELGWVRARLGRHEEAVTAYARAATLYEAGGKPAAGQAHRGRGYCLAALGRTEEAIAAYRRSLKFDRGSEIASDAITGLAEPAAPTPAPAGVAAARSHRAAASEDDVARLAAATAAGGVAWEPDDDAAADERSFTCSEGGRTITIGRRGRRYRLVVRHPGEQPGAEVPEGVPTEVEEEQDGLLKRSRRLKPLYGVVARRTRVLER